MNQKALKSYSKVSSKVFHMEPKTREGQEGNGNQELEEEPRTKNKDRDELSTGNLQFGELAPF